MIEQTAVVTDVSEDLARVKIYRQSTCGGCQVKSACGTSTFAKILGNKFSEMTVLNLIHAVPGDVVKIGLRESVMLQSAFLVYIFPLMMLLMSALIMEFINRWLLLEMGQMPIIVGGLTGLFVAFFIIKKNMSKRIHDERYQPVIIAKASEESSGAPEKVNLLKN